MAGISKEQIWAVANKLDANGQRPTLAAVRQALGSGSYSTISEGITVWKARKKASEEKHFGKDPAPQELADRLSEVATEVWGMAQEMANGRLASEKEALEAVRRQLQTEKDEAVDLADELTSEIEELKSHLEARTSSEGDARQEVATLREQLFDVMQRLSTCIARLEEKEKRLEDLNRELARINAQNSDLLKAFGKNRSVRTKKGGVVIESERPRAASGGNSVAALTDSVNG